MSLVATLSMFAMVFAPLLTTVTQAATAPAYTTSRYMSTVDPTKLYNMGCALGQTAANTLGAQEHMVILDFGYTRYNSADGTYGTALFSGAYASTAQIATAVENYARGYYTCSGQDKISHLKIGVGTNNKQTSTSAVTYNHGSTWAWMVNTINSRLVSAGHNSMVTAIGATDIEMSWNTVYNSKQWVDGYVKSHQYALYNYGDAGGCPSSGSTSGACNNGWTTADVYYVSYGASAANFPIPEIYRTDGIQANQWKHISLYGAVNKGKALYFPGVLTQWQACNEVGGCTGINNTPSTGWTQLYNAINSDSRTAQSNITYSTDISWNN